jgi:hypothetical protein
MPQAANEDNAATADTKAEGAKPELVFYLPNRLFFPPDQFLTEPFSS